MVVYLDTSWTFWQVLLVPSHVAKACKQAISSSHMHHPVLAQWAGCKLSKLLKVCTACAYAQTPNQTAPPAMLLWPVCTGRWKSALKQNANPAAHPRSGLDLRPLPSTDAQVARILDRIDQSFDSLPYPDAAHLPCAKLTCRPS